MAHIGIEEARQHWVDIIRRVEEGEEIVLTRCGQDIAYLTAPVIEQTRKSQAFSPY